MILAVDVHYSNGRAFVAAVSFDAWDATVPLDTYETDLKIAEEYVPGQFYKRELPGILKLLSENALVPECIVVDGYVHLGEQGRPGLGMYLYEALEGKTKVIGVAKTAFAGIDGSMEIHRGKSKRPLFVTAAGMDAEEAKTHIIEMHGENRIPALLKDVDRMCRERAANASPGGHAR